MCRGRRRRRSATQERPLFPTMYYPFTCVLFESCRIRLRPPPSPPPPPKKARARPTERTTFGKPVSRDPEFLARRQHRRVPLRSASPFRKSARTGNASNGNSDRILIRFVRVRDRAEFELVAGRVATKSETRPSRWQRPPCVGPGGRRRRPANADNFSLDASLSKYLRTRYDVGEEKNRRRRRRSVQKDEKADHARSQTRNIDSARVGHEGERVGGKIQNVALDHQHDTERQTEVHVSNRERDADAVDGRAQTGGPRLGSGKVPDQMDRQPDAERRHRLPAEPSDHLGDGALRLRNAQEPAGRQHEARNLHREQRVVRQVPTTSRLADAEGPRRDRRHPRDLPQRLSRQTIGNNRRRRLFFALSLQRGRNCVVLETVTFATFPHKDRRAEQNRKRSFDSIARF